MARAISQKKRSMFDSERRTRLLLRRRREVANTNGYKFMARLNSAMGALSGKLKNAELVPSSHNTTRYTYVLNYLKTPIAEITIFPRIKNGVAGAVIEAFQGKSNVRKTIAGFKEENAKPWNVFLVESAVAAAYTARFDRVMLTDITTTKDYERPVLNDLVHKIRLGKGQSSAAQEVRKIMETLYKRTAHECGLTKLEGDENERYYVREFP